MEKRKASGMPEVEAIGMGRPMGGGEAVGGLIRSGAFM